MGQARRLLSWGRASLLGDPATNLAACHQASSALAGPGPQLSVCSPPPCWTYFTLTAHIKQLVAHLLGCPHLGSYRCSGSPCVGLIYDGLLIRPMQIMR